MSKGNKNLNKTNQSKNTETLDKSLIVTGKRNRKPKKIFDYNDFTKGPTHEKIGASRKKKQKTKSKKNAQNLNKNANNSNNNQSTPGALSLLLNAANTLQSPNSSNNSNTNYSSQTIQNIHYNIQNQNIVNNHYFYTPPFPNPNNIKQIQNPFANHQQPYYNDPRHILLVNRPQKNFNALQKQSNTSPNTQSSNNTSSAFKMPKAKPKKIARNTNSNENKNNIPRSNVAEEKYTNLVNTDYHKFCLPSNLFNIKVTGNFIIPKYLYPTCYPLRKLNEDNIKHIKDAHPRIKNILQGDSTDFTDIVPTMFITESPEGKLGDKLQEIEITFIQKLIDRDNNTFMKLPVYELTEDFKKVITKQTIKNVICQTVNYTTHNKVGNFSITQTLPGVVFIAIKVDQGTRKGCQSYTDPRNFLPQDVFENAGSPVEGIEYVINGNFTQQVLQKLQEQKNNGRNGNEDSTLQKNTTSPKNFLKETVASDLVNNNDKNQKH